MFVNKFYLHLLLLSAIGTVITTANAAPPIYADGDLAPLGAPDGVVNSADYLIANRIVLDGLTATELELSHGDLYPVGSPDEVINVQDLLLLQQLILDPNSNNTIETINLFTDGPATVTVGSRSTTITTGGYIGSGASVTNDPNFTDPEDPLNTIWKVDISGGVANVFMGTGNLDTDPFFDSGFNFSGMGQGQLVFDIKVNSIDPNTTLTVKMDSGYPNLGQTVLTPFQYSIGSWQRVSINFDELLADPGPGAGLNLNNVVNAFVIEVTGGSADFYLDNIFVSHSCQQTQTCHAAINTKPEFSLVWSDEFDGSTLDNNNWSYETGYGSNGWGNDEWQLYTNSSNNVSVANGLLSINAQCANPPSCGKRNGSITSGRILSLNKFAFKYGKIEARLKPPVGKGAWPAFWMLGKNFPQVGWPRTGEIDIMEMNNRYSDEFTTHFTMHYCDDSLSSNPCSYDPGWKYTSQFLTFPDSLGDDFHVFSAEWTEESVIGKIDGIPYFNLAINPATMAEFLEEFFMLFNVAIGGTLGGAPTQDTTWPQTMQVDYVRVYQEDNGNGSFTIGPPPVAPEMGIYSESHTESTLPYNRIINGADFGGNLTNTNENYTFLPQLDGNLVLAADFINSRRSYGGFIFDFSAGQDISNYQTLKFGIDTSAMANFANLTVQIENPGGSQPAPKVSLSAYTPVISNNWAVYEIPLNDFLGQTVSLNLNNVVYLGFWNARSSSGQLTFGTLYFDDIHLAGGGQ